MSSQKPENEGGNRPPTELVHEISSVIEDIDTIAERGHQKASSTEENLEEIAVRASEARQSIAELNETLDRIYDIVDLIDDVADKTDVLALNASIEAARAGGEGDGFAVVADEVKQLAQKTHDQTEEIEAFVATIESDLDQSVETLEHVNKSISEAIGVSQGASSSLSEIQQRIDSFQNTEGENWDTSLD
ncbi:methyl-accepting chemotaxis protein [Halobellus litoreus]|uniref:Methyl-accepting chemotaxis protein n=1 Tax=Halobellus litoreus TaxID=755310 RepID=A0ABD6E6G8_9EURY|nr:methyl-accepting chemotaxis protein [Halobellus litoreus]